LKILMINPDFPPSYWSFPEQLKFQAAKTMLPPLGLLTVAAILPQHWEIRLVDLAAQPATDLDWAWADLVMLSGMLIQKDELLVLIREAKRRGKTVVTGGPYATSVPDEPLAAGCDFVVKGEAENTIPILIEKLKQGQLNGVIEYPEKPDVSQTPVPRFDLIDFRNYASLGIQTSRGCPFDCEFCDIVNLYGSKPRYKTSSQIISELDAIYKLGWRSTVFICDDNFIGSRKHAKSLLKDMNTWMKDHSSPFSFITQASVNLGQDKEMIDLMTEPNFSTVFVGLESPDEDVLAIANKFQNIRNPMLESVRNINKNGLTVLGSFIIGFDGERPGAGQRIASFVDIANIPVVMINKLQAAPNTKLWDRLKKEKRLCEQLGSGNSTIGEMNFLPSRPETDIDREFVALWDEVYDASNFLRRTYNYYLTMRPTRKAMAKLEGRKSAPESITPRSGVSLYKSLLDLSHLLRLCWLQGVVSKARVQYWKQFFGILRRNPSRFVQYLTACAMGEDMFELKRKIIEAHLREEIK
jgi:radical SAM superfamily enzyme YgiQ (UPF0313 family)